MEFYLVIHTLLCEAFLEEFLYLKQLF